MTTDNNSTEETARRLADAASPGPWWADTYRHVGMDGWTEISGGRILRESGTLLVTDHVHKASDAEFIVFMRNNLDALLAAVRADERTRIATELESPNARSYALNALAQRAAADLVRGIAQERTEEKPAADIWADVRAERVRAHAKHGVTSMESASPLDPTGRRYRILTEEVGEVAREFNDAEHDQRPVDLALLRKELIQVAAMAGAWADACGEAIGAPPVGAVLDPVEPGGQQACCHWGDKAPGTTGHWEGCPNHPASGGQL